MNEGSVVGGRFRIERRIGEGGMGSVWTAVHVVTRKRVALKVLHRRSNDTSQRFLREARAACAFEHENAVTVMDFFQDEDGTAIMVMELLEGETLRARLERVGTLEAAETLEVMVPVIDAVATAHAAGVVHRDLKPENIFITRVGTPKVLDFGIAMLKGDDDQGRLTPSGAMMGTVRYMSPEQASAERATMDHRADIWALGAILYECLSGRGPVAGESAGVVIANLLTKPIVPIRELVAGVPDDLAGVVDTMLAREPEDRPADLGAVLTALGHAPTVSQSGERNARDAATLTFDAEGSSGRKAPTPRDIIRSDGSALGSALTETPVETRAQSIKTRPSSAGRGLTFAAFAVVGAAAVYLSAGGPETMSSARSEASIIGAASMAPAPPASASSEPPAPREEPSSPASAAPEPGPRPRVVQPSTSASVRVEPVPPPSAPIASAAPSSPKPHADPSSKGPRGIEDKPPF